jgi:hypothetical protein
MPEEIVNLLMPIITSSSLVKNFLIVLIIFGAFYKVVKPIFTD